MSETNYDETITRGKLSPSVPFAEPSQEWKQENLRTWRDRLPPETVKGIPITFQFALDRTATYYQRIEKHPPQENRLAVAVSCYDSAQRLPHTLREIIEQMKDSQIKGEVFVVLNNGGGNTREYLIGNDQEETRKRLISDLGVQEVIYGRSKENDFTANEHEPKKPRYFRLEKELTSQAEGIRLVVIDQAVHPDNEGKIRASRDLYATLHSQVSQGYRPQFLLTIDDETRLRPVNQETHRAITDKNSGLAHMVGLCQGGQRLVGAKLAFIPYKDDGNPNWEAKLPTMQRTISFLNGHKGYEWCPAGATLGPFGLIVSMQRGIHEHYSGARIEDVMMTVMARTLGITTLVDESVIHTNRCPPADKGQDCYRQIARWLAGMEGLKKATGEELTELVLDVGKVKTVLRGITGGLKGQAEYRPREVLGMVLEGVGPFFQSAAEARQFEDDFENGKAVW